MGAFSGALLCLAYIFGLLLTALPGKVIGLPIGAIAFLLSGVSAGVLLPRWWRRGPRRSIWFAAGLIGFFASLYFQMRLPTPSEQDISRMIPDSEAIASQLVFKVQGRIETAPRLTRNQTIRFWLRATQASATTRQGAKALAQRSVEGRVYTTVPLLMGTGLHPGQTVTLTGSLYHPKPATNPGGFDFQAYLAQEGGFAGLRGKQAELLQPTQQDGKQWGWWAVRQRIVRSQVRWLGVPEAPLLSAMVMGRNGVDVPYTVQDQFAQIGLAHALAASGFQVSLLTGVILKLTQRLKSSVRLMLGLTVLLTYIGLTGAEPSVLRAGVMGGAALWAMAAERKIKPLGSLLLAATLLLLINPVWIWSLAFQLSFLATLGLLVTAPVLTQWLDGLPSAIAPLIAVPIAAYLWTLPLQLYAFGVVSPYSIPINILTTPLLTVVSMGGMLSAVAALVQPVAGSAIAWLLYYPTHWLIQSVAASTQLPGSAIATGQISALQVIGLYGMMVVLWWQSHWWRYWWVAGFASVGLIAIPLWQVQSGLLQVTILTGDPVLVLQDQGQVTLINSGDEANTHFTLLPFLRQQGINQIDVAIATDDSATPDTGLYRLLQDLPVRSLHQDNQRTPKQATNNVLVPGQTLAFPSSRLNVIQTTPSVLQFQMQEQQWLALHEVSVEQQQQLVTANQVPTSQVVWWAGVAPTPQLLAAIAPEVAIASARTIPPETMTWLNEHQVKHYVTGQDGAVQWTPQQGFTTVLHQDEAF